MTEAGKVSRDRWRVRRYFGGGCCGIKPDGNAVGKPDGSVLGNVDGIAVGRAQG
jgi:hypothetical protein